MTWLRKGGRLIGDPRVDDCVLAVDAVCLAARDEREAGCGLGTGGSDAVRGRFTVIDESLELVLAAFRFLSLSLAAKWSPAASRSTLLHKE